MDRVSPSKITTYLNCGMQYYFRYLENKIIPPPIALIRGRSIHKTSERNFSQKIKSKEDLPKKEILEILSTEFDEIEKKEGVTLKKDENLGAQKDETMELGKLYRDEFSPKIQPELTEWKETIQVNPEISLVAVLDLLDIDQNIIDLKTGKKKNQEMANIDLQLSFQALVYKSIKKQDPKSVGWAVLVNNKKPELQEIKSIRDNKDYTILISYINAVVKGIRNGIFLPASQGWWGCNQDWCGFWVICPYKRKE